MIYVTSFSSIPYYSNSDSVCQSFYLGTRLGKEGITDHRTEPYPTNNGE